MATSSTPTMPWPRCARRRGRRRLSGAVRHQRRHAAHRGGARRRRQYAGALPAARARHPCPQRHRCGRGQHPGGGGGGRGARAGHHERLWRALRQRQPLHRHPQPRSSRWATRRWPMATSRVLTEAVALCERDRQPAARRPCALCGQQRLCPQGGAARQRPAQEMAPATSTSTRPGGQPDACARLRAGGARQHRPQAERAGTWEWR